MKKRTYRKLKKLLPRVALGLFALFLIAFGIYHSVDSLIKLHNGASYESIDGRRYSPVVNETLVLMGIGVIILVGVKLVTKWSNLRIAALGTIIYSAIGLFAYWALQYTHQDVAYGFGTIAIMTLAIVLFVGLVLFYEACVRKKRKQKRNKHPVVTFSDAIEKRRQYTCACDTGNKISLGLSWMKAVNIVWVIIFTLAMLFASFDATLRIIALIAILVFTGIVTFTYVQLYRDMIKHGHTLACSRNFARVGIWYQARTSGYYIYTPRPPKVKSVKSK